MKQTAAFLTALALFSAAIPAVSAGAAETCTYEDQLAQEDSVFPDPEASFKKIVDGIFSFCVYDEYAVLAECSDKSITETTIPSEIEGVPVLGSVGTPFGYCRSLKTLRLPETFRYIDWFDLTATTVVRAGSTEKPVSSLTTVTVPEENPYFTVSDGMVFSKDMTTLVGCPSAAEVDDPVLPAETGTVGDYAFAGCASLKTVTVPETVAHLCNGAFVGCTNLQAVSLPESITAVCSQMFYGCSSLREVKLNGAVQKIGSSAFAECAALKDFTVPDTVTAIGYDAFENAGCVEHVNGIHYMQKWVVGSDEDIVTAKLRSGTVGIAETAINGTAHLKELDIPDSVRYLGYLCVLNTGGCASRLQYHGAEIGDKTFTGAVTATDVYIYDPACKIADSEKAIRQNYRYTAESAQDPVNKTAQENSGSGLSVKVSDYFEKQEQPAPDGVSIDITPAYEEATGKVTIHGYRGSTAEAYAEKYERPFVPIPTKAVSGDVSGDGKTRIADAVLLARWLLQTENPYLYDWQNADLNGNGRLDAADLTLLKRMLLNDMHTGQNTVTVSDTEELLAAVENAKPGDVISVMPGTYKLKKNEFEAYASGTADAPITLTAADPDNPPVLCGTSIEENTLLFIDGDYWIIENMVISTALSGIRLDSSNHSVVRNCEICNVGLDAVWICNGSSDCTVENCWIHDTGQSVNYASAPAVQIGHSVIMPHGYHYETACDRNRILGCTFKNVTAEHVLIKEFTTGTEVADCLFYGDGMRQTLNYVSFVTISGNDCHVHDNTGYRNQCDAIDAAFSIEQQVVGWGTGAVFENNRLFMDEEFYQGYTSHRNFIVDGWHFEFTAENNLVDYGDGLIPARPEFYNIGL